MILEVYWTIPWHNPTYKRRPLDHSWWGLDKNISKMIPDESWAKSRPIDQFGPKYIQYDPWGMLDYSMAQPDVQEATIRPFLVGIGQKYIQNDPWWILDKIPTNRPIWPTLDRNVSSKTIPDVCWTIPWHNPTYKRQSLDLFSQELDRKIPTMIPWWMLD